MEYLNVNDVVLFFNKESMYRDLSIIEIIMHNLSDHK